MKKIIFLLPFLLIFGILQSQTQIYILDFETAGGYTTSIAEFVNSSTDYFTRTDGSNIDATFSNIQGSWYFAGQDIDANGDALPVTLTIDDINISGYSNLQIKVYLAEDDADDGKEDWDAGDYVHIDYDIDNSGTFQNGIWIENDGSSYNGAPKIDTDYDGVGDGTEITDVFTQFSVSVPQTGSLMDIKITFNLNSGDEDIAIDNIEVWGEICQEPTTNASSVSFNVIDCDSIQISWSNGDGANRIVAMREGNPVVWQPADGNTYAANSVFGAGTDVNGDGTYIVYNGNQASAYVSGLTGGTEYYVKIFEYNCSAGNEDYLTDGNEATGSVLVNPCDVQNLKITCLTNTKATLTWDLPQGNYTGVVIGIREGTNDPHSLASYDASSLTADPQYGNGTQYGSTTPYSYVVYKGTGTTVTITGLTKGNDYVIKAYVYLNETGSVWSLNQPTKSITNLGVQDVSDEHSVPFDSRIDLSWSNPTTCYDEIMVVATDNGSVTAVPSGDGSSYVADNNYGSGTEIAPGEYVVYKGTDPFCSVYNLTNETNYCFKIFVRKGDEWSDGIELCDTPHEITEFLPGDLIFVAYDSKVGDPDCDGTLELTSSEDVYYILTFVDIKPGTEFGILNASYEYGAAANQRTDEFWSCTSTPGTYIPSRVTFRWEGSSNIAAGSIIKILLRGDNANPGVDSVYINGTDRTSDFVMSGNYVNMSESSPDQIWIYQGVLADYGSSPNIYSKLYGKILYGLSNQADWVPFDQDVNTPRTSRLHPDLECFNMAFPGDVPVNYYNLTAPHSGSKRTLLQALMDNNNWTTASNTQCYNLPDNQIATTTFTITSGNPDGTWIGDKNQDWFNCANWEALRVPDKNTDVILDGNSQQDPVIDVSASAEAEKYDSLAQCNNLYITNHTLIFGSSSGDTLDRLKVFGNLTIDGSGALKMNTGTNQDGVIYLYGNWTNNLGENAFDEGKGTIRLMGTAEQTINTTGGENFAKLIVDNHANQILLQSDITADSLVQYYGKINLNGKALTLEGDYIRKNDGFVGNANSALNIINSGRLDTIVFIDNLNLKDFDLNRNARAILGSNLIVDNLNINQGIFEIPANIDVTVNTAINNNVGSDGLLLKSDASGTASLIHPNTGVPATCERYMSGGAWHYFFSPLDNSPIDSLVITSWGGYNNNLYWYDETKNDYWWAHHFCTNIMGWTLISTSTFETDKGYIFYAPENRVHTLKGGNLFAGDKTFTLSYTSSGSGTVQVCDGNNTEISWTEFDGWNLVGNPYPSAIDWDAVSSFSNMENVIYYYDGNTNSYKYYRPPTSGDQIYNHGITVNGGSRYIPPHQAFLVKATAAGSLTIPQSARVHNDQQYWKNYREPKNIVRLVVSDNGYSDETVFQIGKNSALGFDDNLDAHKRFAPNDLIPQICSYDSSNTFFAINTMPPLEHIEVPIMVYYYTPGTHRITCKSNTLDNYYVALEDKLTNTFFPFNRPGYYEFDIESGFNRDRFVLHFNLNHTPYLLYNISDISVPVYEDFRLDLPENLFDDVDYWDENLNISVSMSDGTPLPDWLKYDGKSFYGRPVELGDFQIVMTATDMFDKKASLSFTIHVYENSTGLSGSQDIVKIYPNPFGDILQIAAPNDIFDLKIYNSFGQIVFEKQIKGSSQIDLKSLPDGVYEAVISSKNLRVRKKIVKIW